MHVPLLASLAIFALVTTWQYHVLQERMGICRGKHKRRSPVSILVQQENIPRHQVQPTNHRAKYVMSVRFVPENHILKIVLKGGMVLLPEAIHLYPVVNYVRKDTTAMAQGLV